MKSLFRVVAASCCVMVVGCSEPSITASKLESSEPPAEVLILGEWTTSTAKEMEASQQTMKFMESGEFNFQMPFMNPLNNSEQLSIEHDGKKVPLRINLTGSWEVNGDRLTARVNHTDQPSVTITEPMEWKIISCSEKKLQLKGQGEGGELITFFRTTRSDST